MYDAWTEAIRGRSKGALGAFANKKTKRKIKRVEWKKRSMSWWTFYFCLSLKLYLKGHTKINLTPRFLAYGTIFLDLCLHLPPPYRRILNPPLGKRESLVGLTWYMAPKVNATVWTLEGYHLFIQMRCKIYVRLEAWVKTAGGEKEKKSLSISVPNKICHLPSNRTFFMT